MKVSDSEKKALLEEQLSKLEGDLKEVEERFRYLQTEGKKILLSAKNRLDTSKLNDVRKRLGI